MGQIEVFEWLRLQRIKGVESFFSVREIEIGMRSSGMYNANPCRVYGAVLSLEAFGYLDARRKGTVRKFSRVVRLKKKYVED